MNSACSLRGMSVSSYEKHSDRGSRLSLAKKDIKGVTTLLIDAEMKMPEEAIVFGASSRGNIRSTAELVNRFWAKH